MPSSMMDTSSPIQTYQYNDCLSCRLIGTGALSGLGGYALWQSRAAAPGSLMGKRALVGVGLVLIGAGAMRWTQKPMTSIPTERN
ncbi:hypothetical protein CPB85DRAFT_1306967 [Mucidula mucida]|nr:hypothetical protein CPB85DRAFT_1306967 [Mucidula mucida]